MYLQWFGADEEAETVLQSCLLNLCSLGIARFDFIFFLEYLSNVKYRKQNI